jgi:hypothetical protein
MNNFIDEAANLSATKIVNTLLHKMRLQRDDDEVDCALYVPILKILMLYPKKLKANISTLLAQTSVGSSFCHADVSLIFYCLTQSQS